MTKVMATSTCNTCWIYEPLLLRKGFDDGTLVHKHVGVDT